MGEAGLIAARAACYVAMMLAAGIPMYLATAGRQADPAGHFLRLSGFAAAAAMAASVWWVLESVAAMVGLPIRQLDQATIRAVLDATPLGIVLAVRMVTLLGAAIAAWYGLRPVATAAATLALATLAWTGHAGASEAAQGALHRASDVVHLIAAATWVGALLLFLISAIRCNDRQGLVRQLSGFATTGSAVVMLLAVTGAANTAMISGLEIGWSTQWTLLITAKIALFLVMVGLAAGNRWRLTPALAQGREGSHRALLISLTFETLAGFSAVVIVAVAGTLPPGG